jgi:hypothetical protein
MPPADTAVKIASVLGLSVILSAEILEIVKAMIKTAANNERKKSQVERL